MSSSGFWELAVGVSADLSEGLTNLVWELGALGVVEEEQPGQGARLRAFFPGTIFASALEAQVRAYLDGLRELGFEPPTDVSVVALADENWADAWRAHFTPRLVGRRLLILPRENQSDLSVAIANSGYIETRYILRNYSLYVIARLS